MKLRSLVPIALSIVAVAALAVACESEETHTADDLEVTPAYTEIRPGASLTLTASGADRYSWSVEDPTLGGLSATKGKSVVYKASSQIAASATQVVTVTGSFGTGVTTNASTTATAQATIAIVVKEED